MACVFACMLLSVSYASDVPGAILSAACATSVTFTSDVIEAKALKGCTALTSITMSDNIRYIGTEAFSGCSNLETVNWSAKLLEIGVRAFSSCSSLTELIFPSKLERIGAYAFNGDLNLATVIFPESLVTIDSAFFNSPYMKMSVSNSGGTSVLQVRNDYYLFTDNYQKLLYMTPSPSITALDLPEETITINDHSLVYYKAASLVIPDSVRTLRFAAFANSNIEI